jgi:acyl carrier protein
MSEIEGRLVRCFASVFPGLTHEEILATNAESNGIWDSLSTVTLAAVVEEEFEAQIDPDVLPQLDSFAAFHAYIQQQSTIAD